MTRVDHTSKEALPKKHPLRLRTQKGLTSSVSPSTSTPGRRAPSRKGSALASARDRRRLRERNRAESERVEKMLATVPLPEDRRARTRDWMSPLEESQRVDDYGMHEIGHCRGCPVCGDARIVTDEVIHGGTLSMSECLHCDHRWTMRPGARWVDLGTRMTRRRRLQVVPTA